MKNDHEIDCQVSIISAWALNSSNGSSINRCSTQQRLEPYITLVLDIHLTNPIESHIMDHCICLIILTIRPSSLPEWPQKALSIQETCSYLLPQCFDSHSPSHSQMQMSVDVVWLLKIAVKLTAPGLLVAPEVENVVAVVEAWESLIFRLPSHPGQNGVLSRSPHF